MHGHRGEAKGPSLLGSSCFKYIVKNALNFKGWNDANGSRVHQSRPHSGDSMSGFLLG